MCRFDVQNDRNLANVNWKRICPVIFQAHRGQNVRLRRWAKRCAACRGRLCAAGWKKRWKARGSRPRRARPGRFARDSRNAEANLRQVDKKAARAELDLRREPDAALEKVFFKVSARGGLLFKKNERECGNLLGRVGAGEVAGVVRRGDKAGMRFKAGDVL